MVGRESRIDRNLSRGSESDIGKMKRIFLKNFSVKKRKEKKRKTTDTGSWAIRAEVARMIPN